ncbi:HepT-like ribonuclease domain-containing protein [Actinokineospora xionganensis]|uniref:DUF86 domain-containing protein n=1 Tax=Actinokineospora xionganensis TaxID=2684470 RepID=A0ABR7LDZ3_9PSEU|nr:DUF86 domain-containing protein [Actinokineospora xionganensis]MBC6450925.1 DUF86 domain-containing protein [Actinokineospora xionganensis]
MNERTAEQLLYLDATLAEMTQLASRGRPAYDADIAVARACQYNVVRLAADLERLGDAWLTSHPAVPWRLIKGMRNRIAHNYWTVDDDIVWAVVSEHATQLHQVLASEITTARSALQVGGDPA